MEYKLAISPDKHIELNALATSRGMPAPTNELERRKLIKDIMADAVQKHLEQYAPLWVKEGQMTVVVTGLDQLIISDDAIVCVDGVYSIVFEDTQEESPARLI